MAEEAFSDQVLHKAGWLARLPQRFREVWLAHGTVIDVKRGKAIYREGEAGGNVYGLISGGVGLILGPPQLTPRMAHILSPGAWFGIGPVLSGGSRSLEFSTTERSTLLLIPRLAIDEIARQEPETFRYLGALANIGVVLGGRMTAELLIPSSARRVAAIVLRIAAPLATEARIGVEGIRVTQAQLAEMANVSRNLANTALGDLRAAGWVETRYNRIAVRDAAALAAYAYGED